MGAQDRREPRLPVSIAVLAAVALQWVLPDQLALNPTWLLPGLELVLFAVLLAGNPVRIARENRWLRAGGLLLTGLISLANTWSAALLIDGLLHSSAGEEPGPLLVSGGAIWLTNIIAFALWYWELDRGGPVARAHGRRTLPDFQFVQMSSPNSPTRTGNHISSTISTCPSPMRPRSARRRAAAVPLGEMTMLCSRRSHWSQSP